MNPQTPGEELRKLLWEWHESEGNTLSWWKNNAMEEVEIQPKLVDRILEWHKAKLSEVLDSIHLTRFDTNDHFDQFGLGFDKAVQLIEDQKDEIRTREGLTKGGV